MLVTMPDILHLDFCLRNTKRKGVKYKYKQIMRGDRKI